MRLAIVVVVAHAALAGVASAGTMTCYAGVDETADAHVPVVIVRELDRDARELRTRKWRMNAPHRELATTFHVAADDHAFTFDARGIHGTGTLDGTAWAWTGYHQEGSAFGGTMISDARIADDTFRVDSRFESGGNVRWRIPTVATAFDCRDLANKRAALDDSGRDAVRTCFAGTQTVFKDASPIVVEQVVERKRIVFITASPKLDNRVVLAIDGASITANNGHAWTGTGTLDGKPGAWTGYSYRARVDDADLVVTGTIGGKRIQRSEVSTGPSGPGHVPFNASLDATAFDCAQLEQRLATLTATP